MDLLFPQFSATSPYSSLFENTTTMTTGGRLGCSLLVVYSFEGIQKSIEYIHMFQIFESRLSSRIGDL